jgi:hypothetical protein
MKPALDILEQPIEPADGDVVTQPYRFGDPTEENADRPRTEPRDQIVGLLGPSLLCQHEPTVAARL